MRRHSGWRPTRGAGPPRRSTGSCRRAGRAGSGSAPRRWRGPGRGPRALLGLDVEDLEQLDGQDAQREAGQGAHHLEGQAGSVEPALGVQDPAGRERPRGDDDPARRPRRRPAPRRPRPRRDGCRSSRRPTARRAGARGPRPTGSPRGAAGCSGRSSTTAALPFRRRPSPRSRPPGRWPPRSRPPPARSRRSRPGASVDHPISRRPNWTRSRKAAICTSPRRTSRPSMRPGAEVAPPGWARRRSPRPRAPRRRRRRPARSATR